MNSRIRRYFLYRSSRRFVKKLDVWDTVFFYDLVAIPVTEFLSKTRITPNQVTILSFLAAIAAAWCFLKGSYFYLILGAITYEVFFLLDCLDGKLARLKNTKSEFGEKLDHQGESFVKLICILALVYSQFYVYAGFRMLAIGLGLVTAHYLFHYIHRILLKKNRTIGYYSNRELLILNRSLGQRFLEKGVFPSIYTYETERFFITFLGPVLNLPREFLVISLVLFLIFKILPELKLLC